MLLQKHLKTLTLSQTLTIQKFPKPAKKIRKSKADNINDCTNFADYNNVLTKIGREISEKRQLRE